MIYWEYRFGCSNSSIRKFCRCIASNYSLIILNCIFSHNTCLNTHFSTTFHPKFAHLIKQVAHAAWSSGHVNCH
jgi:hypothetical protein